MKIRVLAMVLMGLLISACNNKTIEEDEAAQYRGFSATQIYQGAEHDLASGDYTRAAKAFEALDVIYPFGQYSHQAGLDIITAYYFKGESASAIASADRFIHLYPRDPHVDYAYYMRGLALMNQYRSFVTRVLHLDQSQRDLTSAEAAYRDFSMLVSLYPTSRYARDARAHLIYLRNIIAEHTLQVAQFYFERRAYLAAINRATEVVQNFPQTEATAEALVIMIKANRILHLDKAANDALKILKLNYPQMKMQ